MNIEPAVFAQRWAGAWNRRDIEAVLVHFDESVEFSSPVAVAVVGVPTLRGKASLRDYWTKALARIESLRFDVRRTAWDPAAGELAIIYDRAVNGKRDRALELLSFDSNGKVVIGEVFYGVTPDP